jgi:O-methyltransferase involved in polyketide biosynthesis
MSGGEADRLAPASHEVGPGDVDRANSARVYDYFLGGDANFAVDREAGEAALSMLPKVGTYARANRAFLGRVVRYLTEQGIDQFLDLGSGMPTVGNVHEAVQRIHPNARVVYVDNEPVVASHARTMLVGAENVGIVQADIRRPDAVLSAVRVTELLDFTRPVAVLAVGVLPFVTDDTELVEILSAYRARCVPGSFLAVSHPSPVGLTSEQEEQLTNLAIRVAAPIRWRTREEISALLDGYRLVEPGVVLVPDWRPDPGRPAWFPAPSAAMSYAAVGRLAATDGSCPS